MTLLASLSSLSSDHAKRGPRCTVWIALAQMTDEEKAALTDAIDNHAIPATNISAALLANGYTVKADGVRRHRKRGQSEGCACDR